MKQQNRKERVPVGDTPFSFLHAARGGSKPVRHASAAFPGRVIKVVGDELQLVAERVLQLVDCGDHVHDGLVHIQDCLLYTSSLKTEPVSIAPPILSILIGQPNALRHAVKTPETALIISLSILLR